MNPEAEVQVAHASEVEAACGARAAMHKRRSSALNQR
jgi:hypothetical protein